MSHEDEGLYIPKQPHFGCVSDIDETIRQIDCSFNEMNIVKPDQIRGNKNI